jgi:hypothetical protein
MESVWRANGVVRIGARLSCAMRRTRWHFLTFLSLHLCAVLVGAAMVHGGSAFALARRDDLVAQANASDPAALAFDAGDRSRAAFYDAARNLFLGAVPLSIAGPTIAFPYALAAYRGWIGGIVAVDGQHRSRLRRPQQATYYLVTILLQLIPYSIAGGAGVNIGWSFLRARGRPTGPTWLGFPREPILDALVLYVLVVPLFLIASLWEFCSPWV